MDYKTSNGYGEFEIVEKKSRFIGYVNSVKNEEEALYFLNNIRGKHSQATHHVYAYVIKENNISRFSDDGEPAKTAGAPVLDVILKEGLTNIIIVVTRYFGGTLLGTGGLVKAYQRAAKEVIEHTGIVNMTTCTEFILTVPYPLWGKVENELKNYECVLLENEFTQEVNLRAICREEIFLKFQKELLNLSNGNLDLEEIGKTFYSFKV